MKRFIFKLHESSGEYKLQTNNEYNKVRHNDQHINPNIIIAFDWMLPSVTNIQLAEFDNTATAHL